MTEKTDRTEFLMIRVTPGERSMIDQLARAELLPTSTYARRALVLAAQSRGIYPLVENGNRAQVEKAGGAVAG